MKIIEVLLEKILKKLKARTKKRVHSIEITKTQSCRRFFFSSSVSRSSSKILSSKYSNSITCFPCPVLDELPLSKLSDAPTLLLDAENDRGRGENSVT
jgi:hypothetical protein